MSKDLPIIGSAGEECFNCGRRFPSGKPMCPHCNEPNPDFVPKGERFAPRPSVMTRQRLTYKDGILVKLEDDDTT